jgi:hypothetical protein
MNLEQQVCSLDLAKRLKELVVKQESYFVWVEGAVSKGNADFWHVRPRHEPEPNKRAVAAFTVAELGDMLPDTTLHNIVANDITVGGEPRRGWRYLAGRSPIRSDSEADIRAEVLIYLIENKLIEV